MTQKLSDRLWRILNDASESCALNSNQLCDIDAARSIMKAWEDAPEGEIVNGRANSFAGYNVEIRDDKTTWMRGKRVKIVEVG